MGMGETEKVMSDKLAHVYAVLHDAIGRSPERQRQAVENMCIYIAEYARDKDDQNKGKERE
jgi:hypothetical protein